MEALSLKSPSLTTLSSTIPSSTAKSLKTPNSTTLSCPALSCPALSCPTLSCPTLSCPILSWATPNSKTAWFTTPADDQISKILGYQFPNQSCVLVTQESSPGCPKSLNSSKTLIQKNP
jgi:hypothetical protein